MLLCGSSLRPPAGDGGQALVRLACDGGFDGLALESRVTLADLPVILAAAARSRLSCPLVFGPLPDVALSPGKRLPDLAAPDDKEEREAAVKVTRATFQTVRALGVTHVVLDLGRVPLALSPEALRRSYARCELDEGEPGEPPWRRARAERRAHSDGALDACRRGLEKLLPEAERLELRVLLGPGRSLWGVPSPRELQTLLHEFSGAPLAALLVPGRQAALETIGLAGPAERWQGLLEDAAALHATDAVGLQSDLLPGLGEVDFAAVRAPKTGLRSVGGRPDVTLDEVQAARGIVAALTSG